MFDFKKYSLYDLRSFTQLPHLELAEIAYGLLNSCKSLSIMKQTFFDKKDFEISRLNTENEKLKEENLKLNQKIEYVKKRKLSFKERIYGRISI